MPLHGYCRNRACRNFHDEVQAYVASQRAAMQQHHVHVGAMFSCIGASTFLYEAALYWHDERTVLF